MRTLLGHLHAALLADKRAGEHRASSRVAGLGGMKHGAIESIIVLSQT